MSCTIIVEFNTKPEVASTFKQLLAEALPDTRAYNGFIAIDVYNNADRDGNIVLVEQWESRGHYEKYLAWRTETGMLEKVGEMLSDEPSIRYFDVVDA